MSKVKKQKPEIPLFLAKLLRMLEDHQVQDFISWNDSEDGFIIPNVPKFTDRVLPKYFKHRNFSSFVRQLNMYGFTKTRSDDETNEYKNPYFIRGNKEYVKRIERKMPNNSGQASGRELALYYPDNSFLEKEVEDIRRNQIMLQQRFMQLLGENQELMNKNKELAKQIQKSAQQKKRLLSLLSFMNQFSPQPQLLCEALKEEGEEDDLKGKRVEEEEEKYSRQIQQKKEVQNFISFEDFNSFESVGSNLLSLSSGEGEENLFSQ